MHESAYNYVQDFYEKIKKDRGDHLYTVLEFGARNINGSIRDIFRGTIYWGIDLKDGKGVDQVTSASNYECPLGTVDIVVCCEVLEHTPLVNEIVKSAYKNLAYGGWFVVTCATDPRLPHSAIDGGYARLHEYYLNVDPQVLKTSVCRAGFEVSDLQMRNIPNHGGDLYLTARKLL